MAPKTIKPTQVFMQHTRHFLWF